MNSQPCLLFRCRLALAGLLGLIGVSGDFDDASGDYIDFGLRALAFLAVGEAEGSRKCVADKGRRRWR